MKIKGCKMRRIDARTVKSEGRLWQSPLLFVSFIAGAVLGSLTGTWPISVSAAEQIMLDSGNVYGADSFFQLLFFCAKYHLCVILMGTSLLGIVLIPATFALRGFVLSCTAASIASSYPESGFILTAAILGLPSLLTVSSLFIIGRDSLRFSTRLLSLYDRRPTAPTDDSTVSDFLVCAAALILAAAIEYSLVPRIVEYLI